jgi:hypothetical protein
MTKKNLEALAESTVQTTEVSSTPTKTNYLVEFGSVSGAIRGLFALGKKRGEIAKILTEERGKLVRYQHVRNVLITPVKKTAIANG